MYRFVTAVCSAYFFEIQEKTATFFGLRRLVLRIAECEVRAVPALLQLVNIVLLPVLVFLHNARARLHVDAGNLEQLVAEPPGPVDVVLLAVHGVDEFDDGVRL